MDEPDDEWIDECTVVSGTHPSGLPASQVEFVAVCGVFGCTYDAALNYNADATVDDGRCIGCPFSLTVGGGALQHEISWQITSSAGVVVAEGEAGRGELDKQARDVLDNKLGMSTQCMFRTV